MLLDVCGATIWILWLMGNDSIFNNKIWDGFLRKLRSLHWVNALGGSDLIKEAVCWISPRLMNDDLMLRSLTGRVEWMPPIADSALLVAAGCCAIGVCSQALLVLCHRMMQRSMPLKLPWSL